jgi:hypothetical protein
MRLPRRSNSGMAWPLRNTMTLLAKPLPQAASSMWAPSGSNQAMSPISLSPPWSALPAKNRRRRKTGCSRRSATTDRVNSSSR